MPRGEGWRESDDARPQSSPEDDASAALADLLEVLEQQLDRDRIMSGGAPQ